MESREISPRMLKMIVKYARHVIRSEAQALQQISGRLNSGFARVVSLILKCRGKVVCTGMGKAGIIAQKVSATLASTGTPSIFLQAAEARHGDLGRISKPDVLLAFSNSGTTEEVVDLVPFVKRIGATIVVVTASKNSVLGKLADYVIEIGQISEPCPLKLAPTASTTAMLAIGDAVALSLLKLRGWTEEDFARLHPGGALGKKFIRVKQIMRTGSRNPIVKSSVTIKNAIFRITRVRAGAVTVIDAGGKIAGIFTDGDLRRTISANPDALNEPISAHMTKNPITVSPDDFVFDAATKMKARKIDEVPVVDGRRRPVGMLDIQDILELGIL